MHRSLKIILLAFWLLNFLVPSVTAFAKDDFIDVPLESLNNNQTIRLAGLISTQSLEFTLPANWKVTDPSWLDLSISTSQLLSLPDSSVTVSLNGLQITSLHIKDLIGASLRVNLPSGFFLTGRNELSFDGMLYLPDDLKTNCKGWDDPSRWLYFNRQSSLHIGFQKQPLPADLSSFPDSFLQSLDHYLPGGGEGTLFVLPDQIKADDLNALTTTAYFLGHQAENDFSWQPQILTKSQFEQLNNINTNVVFVNNLPAQLENTISPEKNAIGIFSSPWDSSKVIMTIVDKNRDDGYTPALIFGSWIKKVLLSGNVAYVDQTTEKAPPAFKNKYSFEELGYLDRTVRGIGEGNLTYKIYIPYDVNPTSANLALQIANSPDLDDNTSSISVNLNGFTVASILPSAKSAKLEPIRVDLPTKRFRPGINYVRVAFDLHIPYSRCDKSLESVWATIFNSSTFQLTYRERNSIPVLNDFPSPFNEYAGVTFVVPNQLDSQTLAKIAQLTFTLGGSSFYTGQPPKLITADTYSTTKSKQDNYILVGLPSENAAIQAVNDFLPQPFKPRGNQLEEGFGVYLPTFNSEASIGLIQMTPSPWMNHGTILVLTGTDLQGVDWAWRSILEPKVREKFSGNLMVIGAKKEAAATIENPSSTNIYFEQTPMVVKIPLIGKFLQQSGKSEEAASLLAIALVGLFTWIALKLTPILSKLGSKLKKHNTNADKEQE